MFVELDELFVEGLIPIDTLPDDRYRFIEGARQLVGERTRRTFAIGQQVRVILDRVDSVEKRLTFGLFEPRPEKKKRPRR